MGRGHCQHTAHWNPDGQAHPTQHLTLIRILPCPGSIGFILLDHLYFSRFCLTIKHWFFSESLQLLQRSNLVKEACGKWQSGWRMKQKWNHKLKSKLIDSSWFWRHKLALLLYRHKTALEYAFCNLFWSNHLNDERKAVLKKMCRSVSEGKKILCASFLFLYHLAHITGGSSP